MRSLIHNHSCQSQRVVAWRLHFTQHVMCTKTYLLPFRLQHFLVGHRLKTELAARAIQGGSRPSNQRHISWGLHATGLPVVHKLQLLGGAVEGDTEAVLLKASDDCFGNMLRATSSAQARWIPCR